MKILAVLLAVTFFLGHANAEESDQYIYDKVAECNVSTPNVPIKTIFLYLGQKADDLGKYVRAGVSFRSSRAEPNKELENRLIMGLKLEQKSEDDDTHFWVTEPAANYFVTNFYIPLNKDKWSTTFNIFFELQCKKTPHTKFEKPEN